MPALEGSVLQLQKDLIRHCADLTADFADGLYGPVTETALRRFQTSYGLTPDGVLGSQTVAALAGPVTGACGEQ